METTPAQESFIMPAHVRAEFGGMMHLYKLLQGFLHFCIFYSHQSFCTSLMFSYP